MRGNVPLVTRFLAIHAQHAQHRPSLAHRFPPFRPFAAGAEDAAARIEGAVATEEVEVHTAEGNVEVGGRFEMPRAGKASIVSARMGLGLGDDFARLGRRQATYGRRGMKYCKEIAKALSVGKREGEVGAQMAHITSGNGIGACRSTAI